MSKVSRFVIWICSKFTRKEIEYIVNGLLDVINNRNPEVKPKDDFKEKHPQYRKFSVDPLPPLTERPASQSDTTHKNYKLILEEYRITYGKSLRPVKHHSKSPKVPDNAICPCCSAPPKYLYYNDGRKRTQLRCKVCNHLFQLDQRFSLKKTKYYCPYCHHALFAWKNRKEVTIYKCCNDPCPHRIQNLNKLNSAERLLRKTRSSQFKLCYQYREYHFKPHQLIHSSPAQPKVNLTKIYNSPDILGLILTFYVSFAISARKTALILRSVFCLKLSYQTVLNYAEAAAFYCHNFNLSNKGEVDDTQAGDEAYIKVSGENNYTFFFISSKSRKITSYHLDETRDTLPATIAMKEALRTADPHQQITFVTDGNPSYPAGIHFINAQLSNTADIQHRKVIGLQNLDKESEEFRPFKQLIERLMRTYKHHVRPSHGFNSINGATALTTLFVTHYNFLRPHSSLKHNTPVHLPALESIDTIQGKWAKIISLAA